MVDHAVMINETFLLESCQTQFGKGGGGEDEVHTVGNERGDGGVDEVHTAGHEHGDEGVDEVQMVGRKNMDEVNTNEQIQNYQATLSKSPNVWVKTKAARKLTPSKKTSSTANVPYYEQPSEYPTTSRGGTNDYIIIVLCIIFDYLKLKIVSELMFSAFSFLFFFN